MSYDMEEWIEYRSLELRMNLRMYILDSNHISVLLPVSLSLRARWLRRVGIVAWILMKIPLPLLTNLTNRSYLFKGRHVHSQEIGTLLSLSLHHWNVITLLPLSSFQLEYVIFSNFTWKSSIIWWHFEPSPINLDKSRKWFDSDKNQFDLYSDSNDKF